MLLEFRLDPLFHLLLPKDSSLYPVPFYQLALLLAFLFPGIRALARLARRQQLLSASELDQKIYVIVVTVLGAIGHFFALNVAIAYFQIVVQGRDGSGVAGLRRFVPPLIFRAFGR